MVTMGKSSGKQPTKKQTTSWQKCITWTIKTAENKAESKQKSIIRRKNNNNNPNKNKTSQKAPTKAANSKLTKSTERGWNGRGRKRRGRCDTSGQSGIIRAGDKCKSCMFKDLNETRGRRRPADLQSSIWFHWFYKQSLCRAGTYPCSLDNELCMVNHGVLSTREWPHQRGGLTLWDTPQLLLSELLIAARQKNWPNLTSAANKEKKKFQGFGKF